MQPYDPKSYSFAQEVSLRSPLLRDRIGLRPSQEPAFPPLDRFGCDFAKFDRANSLGPLVVPAAKSIEFPV
jgi:hypothetical protein